MMVRFEREVGDDVSDMDNALDEDDDDL